MATTDTTTDAATITDDMSEVKARTTSDGLVEGTVGGIEPVPTDYGDQYLVTIEMPYGPSVERHFTIPNVWLPSESAFVRWIEHYGYTAENIERMIEDDAHVAVEVDGDDRTLVVPDPPEPRWTPEKIAEAKEVAALLTTFGAWLATVVATAVIAVNAQTSAPWYADMVFGGLGGAGTGLFTATVVFVVFAYLDWIDPPEA